MTVILTYLLVVKASSLGSQPLKKRDLGLWDHEGRETVKTPTPVRTKTDPDAGLNLNSIRSIVLHIQSYPNFNLHSNAFTCVKGLYCAPQK